MSALRSLILAATAALLPLASGCSTEAYCFSQCDGDPLKSGTADGGSAGSGSGGTIGVGGSNSGSGGSINLDGGSSDAGCGLDELCDGIDNDCDGEIDEDFDFTQPETCGNCATNCRAMLQAVEQDSIVCTPPDKGLGQSPGECSFTQCTADFWDADGDPETGCEYYCVWNPDGTNEDDLGGANGCGKDDDCDGLTDEDVDTCDVENCGRCGKKCVIANATAKCEKLDDAATCTEDNTQCAVKTCKTGYYDLDGIQTNGCEYQCTPTGGEVCDGVDNDCDGLVDNADPDLDAQDAQVGSSCKGGTQGVCAQNAHAGVRKCIDAQVKCCDKGSNAVTSPYPNFPATGVQNGVCDDADPDPLSGVIFPGELPETCNNQDDDCDGTKDELADLIDDGDLCGPDQGICQQGTMQCINHSLVCIGGTVPGIDICNGTDDDCDGVIDGVVGPNPVVCTGNPSVCTNGKVCRDREGGGSVCADPPVDVATRNGTVLTPVACSVPPSPPCWNKVTGDAVPCSPGGPNVEPLPQDCGGGVLVCDTGSLACVGDVGPTEAGDQCGEDTNCNGTYDAQVDFLLDENNCGGCGQVCGTPGDNRAWVCLNGDCNDDITDPNDPGYVPCLPGFIDCDGDGLCHDTCVFKGAEQCNGEDDDCDCQVDEDDGPMLRPKMTDVCGVSPSATDAACKDTNVLKCQGGSWVCDFSTLHPGYCTNGGNCLLSDDPCEPTTGTALDQNCSGSANEDFLPPLRQQRALGQACRSDDGLPPPGHGDCSRLGFYECVTTGPDAGQDTFCTATTKDLTQVHQEECNGEDDDCDGLVDEYKNTNVTGSYVQPAVVQVGSTYIFQYEASRPLATASDPGSGNGYHVDLSNAPENTVADATLACSAPNRLPWFNVTPDEAIQTCEAIGGRLCDTGEWQDACNGPEPANSCTWAYASSCTSPADYGEGPYCNLADYLNASSVIPTSSPGLIECYAPIGSNIYDLTGNLREITQGPEVQGEPTYPLMGGAFTTESEDGAACSFSFYSVDLQFSLYDAGFRCCFDSSPL